MDAMMLINGIMNSSESEIVPEISFYVQPMLQHDISMFFTPLPRKIQVFNSSVVIINHAPQLIISTN